MAGTFVAFPDVAARIPCRLEGRDVDRQQIGKTDTPWLNLLGAGRDQAGGAGGAGGAMVRLAHLAAAAHQYQVAMGTDGTDDTDQLRVQGRTPRHVDTTPLRGSTRRESSR